MMRVVITGASGLLGTDVVKHFVETGYEVLGVDITRPKKQVAEHRIIDLTNMGECYSVLAGADAVIHLAAIPNAVTAASDVTFRNNVTSTYNILEAANTLGIKKAVTASSECTYGIVFSQTGLTPKYIPIDEQHPTLPEDCYGLGKILEEETASAIHRRNGMQIVALRIGNVMTKEMYAMFPDFIKDPTQRIPILWSYIDSRDIATACQLAIEKENLGFQIVNIMADHTSMDIPSIDLLKSAFPNVTDIRSDISGYQSLYSNQKAKEILGWKPVHVWRDNLPYTVEEK